jgi:integral membrane protein
VTDPAHVRTLFRTVAFAEACSWLGLLVGMYFKYVPADGNDIGVKIFGPIHGCIFLGYLVATLTARSTFRWSLRTTALAALSSIPPFASALFEVLADRRGFLRVPEESPLFAPSQT